MGSDAEAVLFAQRSLRGGVLARTEDPDSWAVHESVWVLAFTDRHDEALEVLESAARRSRGSSSARRLVG